MANNIAKVKPMSKSYLYSKTNASKKMYEVVIEAERIDINSPEFEDIKYQVTTGASFENSLSDKKVSNVFFVESTNDPRLIVDVTDITEVDSNSKIRILNGIKSIRYWYFDFDAAYTKDYSNSNYVYQYTPEKSGYNFVFGINLYPADIRENGNKRYVYIYITKTTNSL